jgi:hypothetical protein
MRDRSHWYQPIRHRLRDALREVGATTVDPTLMCKVELGLTLLEQVAPTASVLALWPLLTGYSFGGHDAAAQKSIGLARHLIGEYRSEHEWRLAVEAYAQTPVTLRAFVVDVASGSWMRRRLSVVRERDETYANALSDPPPYRRWRAEPAGEGVHLFKRRNGTTASVRIPAALAQLPTVSGHDLTGRSQRSPLVVSWQALVDTARWMNQRERDCTGTDSDWERRLQDVRLELRGHDGTFARAPYLTIDGILHLVGMVSAGKSTLLDVLAVYAARNGLHTTLVVGDVRSVLRKVELFTVLGIEAAPVLGSSTLSTRVERQHRQEQGRGKLSLLDHVDSAFDYLSTACVLDGLRSAPRPLDIREAPCTGLHPRIDEDSSDGSDADDEPDVVDGASASELASRVNVRWCCLWGVCPRNIAARRLVSARVWVVTPASLVSTLVPSPLNSEQLRYAELVYRKSDLVLVDEADLVQVNLDTAFSPAQVLAGPAADAWLDRVLPRALQVLTGNNRLRLRESEVSAWMSAARTALQALDRVYGLLGSNPQLTKWVTRDYFTAQSLFDALARMWAGVGRDEAPQDNAAYIALRTLFSEYLRDPLAERGLDRGEAAGAVRELAELALQAVSHSTQTVVRERLLDWVVACDGVALANIELDRAVRCLEFTLVLAVLADRLDLLIGRLKDVEGPLDLEGGPSFAQKPPEDFAPVIPAMPMGNVLGFQYRLSGDGTEQSGTLSFFRCAGVGRWLLLNFHELFAADGLRGPHVLLVSGTSWGGTSDRYHVQVPVGGILRAPDGEVAAIGASRFAFRSFRDPDTGAPLTVSGKLADERAGALRAMVHQLANRGGLGGPSILERERAELDDDRQRILLVTGNYVEAEDVCRTLIARRPDWEGAVRYLVSDDEGAEHWSDGGERLRRGDVAEFANTGAWILVAPLAAIERGHNILNMGKRAALGAAFFLVRPHPRPDDPGHVIHGIAHWALERDRQLALTEPDAGLIERARAFSISRIRPVARTAPDAHTLQWTGAA